jgi:hypothetical protein
MRGECQPWGADVGTGGKPDFNNPIGCRSERQNTTRQENLRLHCVLHGSEYPNAVETIDAVVNVPRGTLANAGIPSRFVLERDRKSRKK